MLDGEARVASLDWAAIESALDGSGWAALPSLLSGDERHALAGLYQGARFRSTIRMQQFGFGSGEYKYFAYPLPAAVQALREAFYRKLAGVANRWRAAAGAEPDFPGTLPGYLELCHSHGQRRPTPLMLHYEAGDHNNLHQDVYGELFFPLQVVVMLSDPAADFTGGELVVTEQRPRMQSRVSVIPLVAGGAAIFAGARRPVQGTRSVYHAIMRHGVSRVAAGRRDTLGLIFHDAA